MLVRSFGVKNISGIFFDFGLGSGISSFVVKMRNR